MSASRSKRRGYAWIAATGLVSILLIVGSIIMFSVFRPSLPNENSPRIFIALGDSVSSGYGLLGYGASPEGVHTSLFFAKLEQEGHVNEYHNFATSGFTTSDLLGMLHGMAAEQLPLFRKARVISLNIGGNNILTPFLTYLSDLQVVSGTGNIMTGAGGVLSGSWAVVYEIISGLGSVASDTEETGFSIAGFRTGIGSILSGFGELFVGTREVIAGSPDVVSAWRGSLSPGLEAMFEEGVHVFTQEFREIISWLEANAPNATLIVNSLYNPIPKYVLMVSVPLTNWADVLIESMNRTIFEESARRGFLVSDISYYFFNRTDFMIFNLNPFAGGLSLDIVHPSAEGHERIAQLKHDTFVRGVGC